MRYHAYKFVHNIGTKFFSYYGETLTEITKDISRVKDFNWYTINDEKGKSLLYFNGDKITRLIYKIEK